MRLELFLLSIVVVMYIAALVALEGLIFDPTDSTMLAFGTSLG